MRNDASTADAGRRRGATLAARLARGSGGGPAPNGATSSLRAPTRQAGAAARLLGRQQRSAAAGAAGFERGATPPVKAKRHKRVEADAQECGIVRAGGGGAAAAVKAGKARQAGSHFFDEEAEESGSGEGDGGSSQGEDEGSDLEGFIDNDTTPVLRDRDAQAGGVDGRWADHCQGPEFTLLKLFPTGAVTQL